MMAQPINQQMVIPQGNMQSRMDMPVPEQEKPEKKKNILASLFIKEPKEKTEKKTKKKEKPEKKSNGLFSKDKKEKKETQSPAGFVIPGMENVKNSTLPEPPKPQGAQLQQQTSFNSQHSMTAHSVMQQSQMQMQQPVMQKPQMQIPQPVMQQPQMQTQQPVMQQPQMQIPQPVMQQPVMQQPQQSFYGQQQNYGGTVVLGAPGAMEDGATTILSEGYNTVQRQQPPYLIRKKTNERIDITKDIFKIGKEQSYVDYCVRDNSAVSRSHANIIKKDNEFYIMDNNSLNHTFLDGKQIPSQHPVKLEDFMVIKMADELFEFRL